MSPERLGGSFRDPAGFVYERDGVLLRHVAAAGATDYDALMASGLYRALADRGWLIAHEEVTAGEPGAHRTLLPSRVPYVSYPYEWCFGQLKDAALLTLDIQLASLEHDLWLKDASAYNVQFVGTRPVFIDTLSFTAYRPDSPWPAYRQFCQHFLAPLALMSHREPRLRALLIRFLDGIPLDLASSLLPRRTMARFGLLAHLHLHARSQRRNQDSARDTTPVQVPRLPRARLVALMHSLRAAVASCRLPERRTEWSHYYADTNYSSDAMAAKEALVSGCVAAAGAPASLLHDVGANTGHFSRLLASGGRYVVSHDVDEQAVELNYRETRGARRDDVLPLVLDFSNPSPPVGWALAERSSALDRMKGGTVVALALVHHLAIGNNVPLPRLASLFGSIARQLVIEFVPREDSQVARLLATRDDIFPDYHLDAFETAFSTHFRIAERHRVPGTARTLFRMEARSM